MTEEEKKKATRARKVAAAIKLLEEEDPTALSVPLPSSPLNPYLQQGQGHYPSALQMLPSPYYSTLAPPPPTYRPVEEDKRAVRFDLRGPDPNAPSLPAYFRRQSGMLATLPSSPLASPTISHAPSLADPSGGRGVILVSLDEDSSKSPAKGPLASSIGPSSLTPPLVYYTEGGGEALASSDISLSPPLTDSSEGGGGFSYLLSRIPPRVRGRILPSCLALSLLSSLTLRCSPLRPLQPQPQPQLYILPQPYILLYSPLLAHQFL